MLRSCETPTEFRRNSVAARLSGTDMPDDYRPPMRDGIPKTLISVRLKPTWSS